MPFSIRTELSTLKPTRDFIISLNHINWTQIPSIAFIIPLPNTDLYRMAVAKGLIGDERTYLITGLVKGSKYSRAVNLTRMSDEVFSATVKECNEAIRRDFYRRHPWKRILAVFGLDHVRPELLFGHFRIRHVRVIFEALLWAAVGKRPTGLAAFVNRSVLYPRV